jgi:hypothetical protein
VWHDSTIPTRSSPVVPAVCIRISRSSRIQWFEESEYLGEVFLSQDREGAVADEQIRADGSDAVDVARDRVDGHPVIEGDPRGDQGAPFDPGFHDEQHIRQSSNDPVSGRKQWIHIDGTYERAVAATVKVVSVVFAGTGVAVRRRLPTPGVKFAVLKSTRVPEFWRRLAREENCCGWPQRRHRVVTVILMSA